MGLLHLTVIFAVVLGYGCHYSDQYGEHNNNLRYRGKRRSGNNYGHLECMRKCKARKIDYWQRFCPSEPIRIYCDDISSIRIKSAKYGSLPCRPANIRFKGKLKCQVARAKVLAHTKQSCEYKKECTGHTSRKLFGKLPLFYRGCAYSKKVSFYAEYQCIPSKTFCGAFCRCRSASRYISYDKGRQHSAAYCKQNYKRFLNW
ncbi:unnamed protein product [Mytilus coruscus]|uniref:SUEL-type lectin domain-containing protein n=1 Tax=Mytilus coruscus TaxID=42192 RepID=A0A6J7ZXR6_MYTCO|nr:unnamed protein product [Mytilus coruscus]